MTKEKKRKGKKEKRKNEMTFKYFTPIFPTSPLK
jgi:hypothetical protein